MKLVMTLLVRDEEDVLQANFECHLAQGVDFFIVTDNLSVDGTRDIIDTYVRRGVAVCLDEPDDDYSQSRWVTRMARLAAERYKATWVINSDADEFWISDPTSAGIKAALDAVSKEVSAIVVPRSNFIPVDEDGAGFFAERMTVRERLSRTILGDLLQPKVCHRAIPDIFVDQGNHCVRHGDHPLACLPGALRILHYPVRSYRQFENKIIKGGAAYARNGQLPLQIGHAWRYLHARWRAGELRDCYQQMMRSAHSLTNDLGSGELVHDETLLEILGYRRRDAARAHVVGGLNAW